MESSKDGFASLFWLLGHHIQATTVVFVKELTQGLIGCIVDVADDGMAVLASCGTPSVFGSSILWRSIGNGFGDGKEWITTIGRKAVEIQAKEKVNIEPDSARDVADVGVGVEVEGLPVSVFKIELAVDVVEHRCAVVRLVDWPTKCQADFSREVVAFSAEDIHQNRAFYFLGLLEVDFCEFRVVDELVKGVLQVLVDGLVATFHLVGADANIALQFLGLQRFDGQ